MRFTRVLEICNIRSTNNQIMQSGKKIVSNSVRGSNSVSLIKSLYLRLAEGMGL